MFELKFTRADLIRAAWTFVAAAVGVFLVAKPATGARLEGRGGRRRRRRRIGREKPRS
jgi:hypothetical protein